MHGFHMAEGGHVALIIPPRDIDTGTNGQSARFKMHGYSHVDIELVLGLTGAASTVTLLASEDAAGTNAEAIAFAVYKQETANGDVTGARVEVTASGFATSTNDNVFYVISVDGSDLPPGKPWLQLVCSDPGASTLAAAIANLTGARYGGVSSPTVLA